MGIVQQDAIKTSFISFVGIGLGYLNKAFLFILLFTTTQVGLINLLMSVGLLFAQFANLGTIYTIWRFFPFFRNPEKQNYGFLFANFLLIIFGIPVRLSTSPQAPRPRDPLGQLRAGNGPPSLPCVALDRPQGPNREPRSSPMT